MDIKQRARTLLDDERYVLNGRKDNGFGVFFNWKSGLYLAIIEYRAPQYSKELISVMKGETLIYPLLEKEILDKQPNRGYFYTDSSSDFDLGVIFARKIKNNITNLTSEQQEYVFKNFNLLIGEGLDLDDRVLAPN